MKNQITGAIIAGGKSSRMGQPKALLSYGTVTIVEHIAEELKPFCGQVLINANETELYEFLGLPIVPDLHKDRGPLSGIEAVLRACNTRYCFTVPCDLPLFSGAIVPLLNAQIGQADVCVPESKGFLEPLVALYSLSALPIIQQALNNKIYKVAEAFQELRLKLVSEELLVSQQLDHIFYNINTADDYTALIRRKKDG